MGRRPRRRDLSAAQPRLRPHGGAAGGPWLTAVVVTCGRDETCRALIDRLSGALSAGDHLIVVDDSRGAIEDSRANAGATTIVHTSGKGAAAARNAGLALCRREWIAFLDDDIMIDARFVEELRWRLRWGEFDVLTANVLSEPDELGRLFDARYPLSRGPRVAIYPGTTGTRRSPSDVWRVGVGACMVWRAGALRSIGGFPVPLGQGRRYGGAEDLAALRQALRHGLTIRYDGELVVRHLSPPTRAALAAKMRGYARAAGAFAAHVWHYERDAGVARHTLRDIARCPSRLMAEIACGLRDRRRLPLAPIVLFPVDVMVGFVGYLAGRRGVERPSRREGVAIKPRESAP